MPHEAKYNEVIKETSNLNGIALEPAKYLIDLPGFLPSVDIIAPCGGYPHSAYGEKKPFFSCSHDQNIIWKEYFYHDVSMEEIKTLIQDSFYTQPLMMLSALIAFVIGLFRRKQIKEFQILILYPLASLTQALIAYVSFIYVRIGKWLQADLISENVFILVESLILYIFFNKIIFLRIKVYMQAIFFLYVLYFVSLWIFTDAFFLSATKMYLIESTVMLFFCLLYLFQLFKIPTSINLLRSLPFWMTIGCLFYFSSTIPLFVADIVVGVQSNFYGLYAINFLAYTVLFLCASKAFLCKPAFISRPKTLSDHKRSTVPGDLI